MLYRGHSYKESANGLGLGTDLDIGPLFLAELLKLIHEHTLCSLRHVVSLLRVVGLKRERGGAGAVGGEESGGRPPGLSGRGE